MARFEGELCDNILLGSQARLPTRYGQFRIHAFVCPFTGEEHVALVKGKVADPGACGVRVKKRIPPEVRATATNARYLRSKKERLRHLLTTPTFPEAQSRRRPGPR